MDDTIRELKKITGFTSYLILNNDGNCPLLIPSAFTVAAAVLLLLLPLASVCLPLPSGCRQAGHAQLIPRIAVPACHCRALLIRPNRPLSSLPLPHPSIRPLCSNPPPAPSHRHRDQVREHVLPHSGASCAPHPLAVLQSQQVCAGSAGNT